MSTIGLKTHQQYTEHKEYEKTQFLRDQTECPICQGELNIFVEVIGSHQVKEEAHCTQCMALSRVQKHGLH